MKKTRCGSSEGFWRFALVLCCLAGFAGNTAHATNGYFSHGYGIKYKSLAGAGVALRLGPLGPATNPATLAFGKKHYDVSLSFFNPKRQYTVTGAPSFQPGTFGLAPGTVKSGSTLFVIPSLAANWSLNDNTALGISIYGNGGMNTNYDHPTFGFKPTGVDLSQLFIAPTLALKAGAKHSFGLTPILSYQRFEANGLSAFGPFSSAADKLSNQAHSNSLGFGARIGYLGEWMDFLSVGASYQTKVMMSEFDDYAGLFAEQGDFDIPANWTVGVALGFEQMGLVFDVQQMLYSGIKSVSNPMLPNLQQARLGDDKGAGFGWKDMTVFKGGVYFQTSGGWTWRAGYSFGKQPIPESEVLFNILAPGVIEQHLTAGFSKTVAGDKEISIAIMRALSNSVSGGNPLDFPGRQTIELKMDQWEFGVGFSF
ncbi:MAG: outer membrane protein transport protein [candidate division KSB1 bacterium]|nr:outer membrane protein transport protein [candidate division KSB1 bacterium]MDZ7274097.1 outer membrane protein transport protein [candidate division KSB1 bacterium]MDZ7287859.1 outer membrane protein transport protein [candidate division KSB1 bacterium]MDZ7296695.1 outer membrane protein transport protein [candidate division KSB1 bacterium]MDZ7306935.1 outer membrane protein transport protein [candidate division KSB1 bacterium]